MRAGALSIPNNLNNFEVLQTLDTTLSPPSSFGEWARVLLASVWAATVRGLLPLSYFFEPLTITHQPSLLDKSINTPMHVILGPAYIVPLVQALQKHLECALQLLAPCMQSAAARGGGGAADPAVRYAHTYIGLCSEIANVGLMNTSGGGYGVSTGADVKSNMLLKTCLLYSALLCTVVRVQASIRSESLALHMCDNRLCST
jgi:hypothetical protein